MLLFALALAGVAGCTSSTGEYVDQAEPFVAGRDEAGSAEGDFHEEELAPEEMPAEDVAASTAPSTIDPDYQGERLVVRNVSMRMEVEDVPETVESIESAIEAAGGIVSMLNVGTAEDPVYRYEAEGALGDGAPLAGYITVRVPADQLEAFTDEVSALGEVLRMDASQDDVTQQYVDLNARLKNLQAREERLRQLYEEAETVEDTLAVDRELSAVRGEIEAMQAQIQYLERQAAMATVTIELIEPAPIVRPAGESWGFGDALTNSLRAFVNTINWMIVLLGALAPFLIIALIVLGIVMLIVRSRRKRRGDQGPGSGNPAGNDAYAPAPESERNDQMAGGSNENR
jgi:hypothetical protein